MRYKLPPLSDPEHPGALECLGAYCSELEGKKKTGKRTRSRSKKSWLKPHEMQNQRNKQRPGCY